MPRPRRSPSSPQLSSGQASYILDKLITERRLSAGEVNRYIGDMQREITDLERRLQALKAASGGGAAAPSAAPRRRGRPPRQAGAGAQTAAAAQTASAPARGRRRRRQRAITPEQLASRVLQGRYLGLIRQIPASRRAQYQRTAKERGREAAIKDMMVALKK